MAEEFEKFKRFEYRMNSNLVLQREGPGPSQNEPTGEPETLSGRLRYPMGDKVIHEGNKQNKDEKDEKNNQNNRKRQPTEKTRLGIKKGSSVLDSDITETYTYKPLSRESRIIYEKLLATLLTKLGDQPQEILKGAADELLPIFKHLKFTEAEKKKEAESIIGVLSDIEYNKYFQIIQSITDFQAERVKVADAEEDADNPTGVAVVFDEDDDSTGEDYTNVVNDDEDEMDSDLDDSSKQLRYLAAKPLDDEEFAEERDEYNLDIQKIDPHWLQRELSSLYSDPNMVVATEKEILSILPVKDVQECENKLVMILKYENFHLAKLILKNRWKIYYCTRLGQAQTVDEKHNITEEMRESDAGNEVLSGLDTINLRRNKEKEIARNVRKEAASLASKSYHKDTKNNTNNSYSSTLTDDGIEDGTMNEEIYTKNPAYGADHKYIHVDLYKPTKQIDLNSLIFPEGSQLMSNSSVKLPEGSQRISKKTYDEVIVQPFKKPQDISSERIQISTMPEWSRSAFSNIKSLNKIQSVVYEKAFKEYDENLLVCAPTGSGKTNIAILGILNVFQRYKLSSSPSDMNLDLNAFKIVYISPMKALVAEQVRNMSIRLAPYNVTVKELTGDIALSGAEIQATQIIVTTPEKWDVVTRKSGDRTYTQLVRLIIIDEVHLLHDNRGPVIEALVARTIRHIETTKDPIRLIGLSATLPNYADVALFMKVNVEKGLFYFGSHFRPVPLLQTYIGIKERKAIKRYNTMNEIVYEKAMENAGINQMLIFVHSRKETIRTAKYIQEKALENDLLAKFLQTATASRSILQKEAENLTTLEVKDILPYGIAVHHAGIPRADRTLIEDLFADRHIQILISTATLAWGVNLPAHTVIIKGTQVYSPEKGKWVELSPMDVMQMLGRGGRPQYDSSGHGIIITNHSKLQYYLSLNNQQLPVESQLISALPDILNAEIVLGTVRNREEAVNWLSYTYFYVRMIRDPVLYGLTDSGGEDPFYTKDRIDIIHSALILLDRSALLKYDKRTGVAHITSLGKIAAHYYIKHPTIAVFNDNLKASLSDIELLRLFSLADEFKYIPVREEEKVELQRLIERVPMPIKGSCEESSSKVNVLLQAYISKLKLDGFALTTDMVYVEQNASRIMRAIFEISLKRGWPALAYKALQFCKMIEKRMWSCMIPLKQFKGVPEEFLRKLERKDFAWERFYDLTSTELGELVRMPKMGRVFHKLIHQFPKLDMSAYVQPLTRTCLLIELTLTPDFEWDQKIHGNSEPFWIFVEDGDCQTILHYEYFILRPPRGPENDHTIIFSVPITEPLPPNYCIRTVSDRWLGAEAYMPISFKALILPEKNPQHTEILDLQPLPVSALKNAPAEAIFRPFFRTFNPIQTQVFPVLYNSDDSVLVCCPDFQGKIVCAEFAIFRAIKNEAHPLCVYIAPYEAVIQRRFAEWRSTLGASLNINIAILNGDTTADIKILETNQLVLSTPEQWDCVSRRWKTRKVLQQIRLLIIDELQLLDSDAHGATMEICVSRMRYISAQLVVPIRMIGIACSLANAKDVGDWLGVNNNGLFNFSPSMRHVPLEISIHGFDLNNRESRLLAMSKPIYHAIKQHAPKDPVIIFVSDRKQCRLTSIDLLLYAAADQKPDMFLNISHEEIEKHVGLIKSEDTLVESLRHGVGFLYEATSPEDREIVERLYTNNAIKVLIVSETLSWGLSLYARLVIIQDTKRFTANGYVDYPMCDMLHMVGKATRQNIDKSGYVVLLTHTSKKEYYKKFFFEPLPLESRLDQRIPDHFNAEIVLKTIENKQDAVDWLTWTFYYRRLTKNPNYYGLQGANHQNLSDHLSELVENTIETLIQAQCTIVEDDNLSALNLGLIASFYFVRYTTIELFNRSLESTTKRKGMLEILSSAGEYDNVPIRFGEETALRTLAKQLGIKISDTEELTDPHIKTLILLYAHFSRCQLSADLAGDQKIILERSIRLTQTLVDVISSNGWLLPELVAMELSQMLVQALTPQQSPLRQIPHFTSELIAEAKKMDVDDVFDLMNLDENRRTKLLINLKPAELANVANACNRYPVISIDFQLTGGQKMNQKSHQNQDMGTDKDQDDDVKVFRINQSSTLRVSVTLDRDSSEEGTTEAVYSPYFPKEKSELWWVVIGQTSSNTLNAIRRVNFSKNNPVQANLVWNCPKEIGEYSYILYFMADAYMGCDQEHKFKIIITK